MISRKLYLNIIIAVSLIVVLSVLLGYFIATRQSLFYFIISILAIISLAIGLVSYLNTTNKNIRFFFDAVRNEDSNLNFPVNIKNKSMRELYLSMNRVNQQIQQLKIENRQQEQYFQTLIEQLAVGIITFNNKGFILHANSSAKKLLSSDVLTNLHQIERIDQKLFLTIKKIKPFEQKLIALPTGNGIVQLSLKATSFKMRDDELIILSIVDIKNELDEKELESWMKLIRVLMHEIMNSITPITSLSESLYSIYIPDGKPLASNEVTDKTISTTLQGLKVMHEQVKGLMSFVESYRKLARVPKPEKKFFKVSDLMRRMEMIYDSIDNTDKTKLLYQLKDPDIEIFADENLISQVLVNLIKNAHEANEINNNCKITIAAGYDVNHLPEICVIDNGPGIREEILEEIFVPFFTTREKGSGIGLSISKQIMQAHGGNLKVRSVPNKETIFCMSFQG